MEQLEKPVYASAMTCDAPGSGRERVLYVLKTKGPQTAARIAKRLGVTPMAVRQHLVVLTGEKLVDFTDDRRKVGRPARVWRLTAKASDQFPDCHAELAVGMLQAIQRAFGEEGIERLTEERTRQQAESYRAQMPGPKATLKERVAILARIRREEGYMAERGTTAMERSNSWRTTAPSRRRRGCARSCAAASCRFFVPSWGTTSPSSGPSTSSRGVGAAPTASPANPTNRHWTEPRSPACSV